MDRVPDKWALLGHYKRGESLDAQAFARFQAHVKAFCERFPIVAPNAYDNLLRVAPLVQRLGLAGELSARAAIVREIAPRIISWVEDYRLQDGIWVVDIAINTVLVHAANTLLGRPVPQSLVGYLTVVSGQDDESKSWRVPIESTFNVEVEFEISPASYAWNPANESPGAFKDRVLADITRQIDEAIERESPVKVNEQYIDWAIDHRVNRTTPYRIAARDGEDQSLIRYWIKTVDTVLFSNNPGPFKRHK